MRDEVTPWDRAAADARDIGQIALRLDEDGEISNRYLWGPAVDQILADEQISWNDVAEEYDIEQILWPLTDHQGTVRDLAAVNEISGDTEILNTRSYDAYGILLAETDATIDHLFGFTARPTEGETGLQNNLNRWYDPEVGTWLNEDLIGFEGGDANLYRYCGNDPVNAVDPSGLESLISEVPVQFGPIQCKLLFYKGVCIGWEDPTGAVWRLHSPGEAYVGGSEGDPRSWYQAWEKKCYVASRAEVDAAIDSLWWGNVDWDAWFAEKKVRETFKYDNLIRSGIREGTLAEDFYKRKYEVEQETNEVIKYHVPLMYGGQLGVGVQAVNTKNIALGGPSRCAPQTVPPNPAHSAANGARLRASLAIKQALARGGRFVGPGGEALQAGQTRVAVFDTATGRMYYDVSNAGSHLGVLQRHGLPVANGRYVGGFLQATEDGKLLFNPTSGTFPWTCPELSRNVLDFIRGLGVSIIGGP